MSKNEKILVIGGSGSVGSELVRILEAEGRDVRTTTGKKEKAGGKVAHVDLATGAGIREAFEGIDRAFFLSPGGYADQYSVLAPLIQEARRRGLRKVVLMTAIGVDAAEGSPLRRAEQLLESSGLAYNILRPNWFMQNFGTFWREGIRQDAVIPLPAGDAKTSFIDTRDISAVAAKLLVSDDRSGQAFTLTGPEALSHDDVARSVGSAIGRPVRYRDTDPAAFKQALLGAGAPEDYVDFLNLIFTFLKAGYNAPVNENVKSITGRDPRTLEAFVRESRSAWI